MDTASPHGSGQPKAWLLAAAALLVGACAGTGVVLAFGGDRESGATATLVSGTPTPGHAALESYTCPAGTDKRIMMGGREDRFLADGGEPARLGAGLESLAFHRDRFSRAGQAGGRRDYDEVGADKHLYESFPMEAGLVSGLVVAGILRRPGVERDGLGLYVDEALLGSDDPLVRNQVAAGTGLRTLKTVWEDAAAGYRVVQTDLRNLSSPGRVLQGDGEASLFGYLDQHLPGRPAFGLSVVVGDDTPVDFLGLATCHRPEKRRGMSWTASTILYADTGLHALSCNFDLSQPLCDARGGDSPCGEPLAVACFREGEREPPPLDAVSAPMRERVAANYLGGEVRLSEPVAGTRFASREAVSAFCEASFGEGWRVLDHHAAGGGLALVWSELPHGTRAWVDIRTAPEATCWAERERAK